MKLYYSPGACSLGIHVLLEEIGKPYDLEQVNLSLAPPERNVTKVNPKARVPTLVRDDGSVLELGSGVAPGDRLALNISSQIKDGDLVRINSADTPGAERLAGSH